MAMSKDYYIKCDNCNSVFFQEMLITKLLKTAKDAVKGAPLDTPVTPMYKEEAEVVYKCIDCGYIMNKDSIAAQKQ